MIFGLCALVWGGAHFVYMNLTAPLVPKWLPPSQVFWGYLTGVAFLARRPRHSSRIQARLAAILLTAMLASFTFWFTSASCSPITNPVQLDRTRRQPRHPRRRLGRSRLLPHLEPATPPPTPVRCQAPRRESPANHLKAIEISLHKPRHSYPWHLDRIDVRDLPRKTFSNTPHLT